MLATSGQVEPPNLDNLSHLENVATVPERLFTPLYEQAQQQHSQPPQLDRKVNYSGTDIKLNKFLEKYTSGSSDESSTWILTLCVL